MCRRKLGWGPLCGQSIAPSDLPLPTLAEPAQTSAASTLPPCSGRPGSLGEGLKATQTQPAKRLGPGSQGKGRGKGWPSEPVGESPVLGTVPTHLARDIVARTAGRGVLGRLSIPGGSGARHARHVPWTRGELGLVAGGGQCWDLPALGSTQSFPPPPPQPGPPQAPPYVSPPRRYLPGAGCLARARTTTGQRQRGRRAPSKLGRLRAPKTWNESSPRTGPQRSQAARARFPQGAVSGNLACSARSGSAATRGSAPGFPLPLHSAACRGRPSPGQLAADGRPPVAVGVGVRLWAGKAPGQRGTIFRGGVHSEHSAQAVLLLLMHPSPSSSECNFIYPPEFTLQHIYNCGFSRPLVGARVLTL